MNIDALMEVVRFNAEGLVTSIAQDAETNEVLMVAYMNARTLRQTLETGLMTYWSRSRQAVWIKGETSGNTQMVQNVRVDCDGDALLFKVRQHGGAACHTGRRSCFYRVLSKDGFHITMDPIFDPAKVYDET